MLVPTIVELTGLQVEGRVFTTLEGENPGGSLKDHLVLGELTALLRSGMLHPGDTVSEISAGSTARSLARHCPGLELRLVLFVPDFTPAEDVAAWEASGASVHRVGRDGAYARYDAYCAEHSTHRFNQLLDQAKDRHYEPLGARVAADAGPCDVVVGAVGTGHSLLGTAAGMAGDASRARRPRIVSAEPDVPDVVPGVRNVELERYGPNDTLTPASFDERVVVPATAATAGVVMSDAGPIEYGPSFALVLEACRQCSPFDQAFALGATNRRLAQ